MSNLSIEELREYAINNTPEFSKFSKYKQNKVLKVVQKQLEKGKEYTGEYPRLIYQDEVAVHHMRVHVNNSLAAIEKAKKEAVRIGITLPETFGELVNVSINPESKLLTQLNGCDFKTEKLILLLKNIDHASRYCARFLMDGEAGIVVNEEALKAHHDRLHRKYMEQSDESELKRTKELASLVRSAKYWLGNFQGAGLSNAEHAALVDLFHHINFR
jgi:hypothetical protein